MGKNTLNWIFEPLSVNWYVPFAQKCPGSLTDALRLFPKYALTPVGFPKPESNPSYRRLRYTSHPLEGNGFEELNVPIF